MILFFFRKSYGIQRKSYNLISMKQHFSYAMIITQSVAFTQIKHIVLENIYSSMEPDTIFYYWWLCYVVSDIGKF